MPLTLASAGKTMRIYRITGKDDVKRHLADLGFVEGVELSVVNELGGNLILNVKGTRIAVDKKMASRILVNSEGNMKTLRECRPNQKVTVVKIHGSGPVKKRIMDMGITKGAEILVRKVAPLGDPIEINIRSYELSLRKTDAEMVEVK